MPKKKKSIKQYLDGKTLLVTGGTGSFGKKFIRTVLDNYNFKRLVIYSRDELKQEEMRTMYGFDDERLRYFIGDVRDKERLYRAMINIDVIVHAAAMKQVPASEYNPIEAVKTNIDGAENIINAAIDHRVKKVIALSTDKAVNPINLYGATKLVAEKLFIQGNNYSSIDGAKLSCVRYGNVVGSRGSVIPLFINQKKKGLITITDKRMTRFWITLDQGVHFVIKCIELMNGGEVFIPKIPSMKVVDLAKAIAPECKINFIGIRPGEKLHEVLISDEENQNTFEFKDMFAIRSKTLFREPKNLLWKKGKKMKFSNYASNTNTEWLSKKQILKMAAAI
ncbi:UDP-N-acetylglucosamine 4,6-dehydratase (inverting) [Candidatus Roizmanbacteria bacterium RIFCSPLOWO2_01_FULL_38_12]|uniref:UDP-N-acetylglucosamine 4,6-dehydratase (Inverting) n=1 Tax=Candidatus Roizmanbacteria bacterium RIFCSPLOWO2_01_FULL_38_12 TaxID=1802061 RepID=A0A1F7IUL0_9BACT|nr:MAG: UDP-N-acetylglucosamine 4,6-dehydratase (inverting) [Candidatus Roizmanbacteria bacterium RIFCSPHIGHO2_01_FULL_38_15]OGK34366.1 MAG: UDP-N-acetylglucosamine 4,6-dehydratase (inverting) [Candidatus Roizmanbacteria bacterium RIFCSPHIGHO2_12_FULL_38_13]OGK47035.1 MAG: UDP-N-acetylglucosamine 4,6-dehydratase (inverting) [Candidatus Roizmanbacteria bacterium RIFCSPLOWO2_01_FULL_38_12]